MRTLIAGTVVAASLVSGAALAQDQPPFRAGTKAAEFSVENPFYGLGLVRFSSPTKAVVLNASGVWDRVTSEDATGKDETQSLVVTVARRTYRRASDRVTTTRQFSLGASYYRMVRALPTGIYPPSYVTSVQRTRTTGVSVGVAGGLEAFLVRNVLSVGARWPISVQYTWGRRELPVYGYTASDSVTPTLRVRQWTVQALDLMLVGVLYF